MPLVVTVEDGTGLADANSYASVAEADAFFASRPRSTAWAALSADVKASYLIHSTRYMDASVIWDGVKFSETQALAFPREWCEQSSGIPLAIKMALYELAYAMIGSDVTADPATSGLSKIVVGPIEIDTTPNREQQALSRFVRGLLSPFGQVRGGSCSNARLVRT